MKIEGDAKELSPVDSGRLRGSITYKIQGSGSSPQSPAVVMDAVSNSPDKFTAHIGTNVEYGQHVEYGTKRSGAQPFMRPALDRNRKPAQKIFSEELSKQLQAANRE
jgi:HK97 gp10 family phage protein